jgi:hypothetical protein
MLHTKSKEEGKKMAADKKVHERYVPPFLPPSLSLIPLIYPS